MIHSAVKWPHSSDERGDTDDGLSDDIASKDGDATDLNHCRIHVDQHCREEGAHCAYKRYRGCSTIATDLSDPHQ